MALPSNAVAMSNATVNPPQLELVVAANPQQQQLTQAAQPELVPPHFKFAITTPYRVFYTDNSPSFLEHLAQQAAQRIGPVVYGALTFEEETWDTLDIGAKLFILHKYIDENSATVVPIFASWYKYSAPKNVIVVRETDHGDTTSTNRLFALQEGLQQPWVGNMQPTVDQEIRWVSSVAKKPKQTKIPRPMNAYMLYRADRHAQIMELVRQRNGPAPNNNARVSIVTGLMWRTEEPATRAYYAAMAAEVKRQFEALYPQYKYRPRRQEEIQRRARRSPVVM